MAAAAGGDVNGDKWWDCRNCIRKAACPIHVPDMVGHAGPNSIQKQLNAAESKLLKAQLMVDALRKSLQRTKTQGGVASGSPTLAVLHSGWGNDDGEGWEPGRLSVSLAVDCAALTPELGAALREAMQDVSLSFGDSVPCPFSCFYADGLSIPDEVLALFPNLKDFPGYGNDGLRPGTVLVYPGRHRLEIYTRKCRFDEGKGAKLLGFLQEDGLKSLAYEHTPNKRSIRFCAYCKHYNYVSIEFEKVELLGVAGLEVTHDLDQDVDPAATDDDDRSVASDDLEQFEDYFYCDLCHERAKEEDCDCSDSDCDCGNDGDYWRILPP